jgi:ribosome maturation factor RimP
MQKKEKQVFHNGKVCTNSSFSLLLYLSLVSLNKEGAKVPSFIYRQLMKNESIIRAILDRIIADTDLFLVNLSVTGSGSQNKVLVVVDTEKGVTIGECTSVSRQLAARMDEQNLFDGSYNLEVTSPGLDQPLLIERQYQKNIGRELKVLLADQSLTSGKLVSVTSEGIQLLQRNKNSKNKANPFFAEPISLLYSQIQKAHIIITFN